jgi:hypothetical protein
MRALAVSVHSKQQVLSFAAGPSVSAGRRLTSVGFAAVRSGPSDPFESGERACVCLCRSQECGAKSSVPNHAPDRPPGDHQPHRGADFRWPTLFGRPARRQRERPSAMLSGWGASRAGRSAQLRRNETGERRRWLFCGGHHFAPATDVFRCGALSRASIRSRSSSMTRFLCVACGK